MENEGNSNPTLLQAPQINEAGCVWGDGPIALEAEQSLA